MYGRGLAENVIWGLAETVRIPSYDGGRGSNFLKKSSYDI